jgi:hypothetical protein
VIRILTPSVVIPGNPITVTTSLAMSVVQLISSGEDLKLGRAIPVRLADGTFSQQEFRLVRQQSFWGMYQGMQDNGSIRLTIIQPPTQ